MTRELYNWLQRDFYLCNHSKYHHLFDMWIGNITQDQIDGFRLWYVCDCTGPAIIVSEPNRVPTRDQEHKIWIVDGIYRSAYVESKFLSKLFGLCAPMIRKELKHYPTLKWEDAPIEIEIGRVKICYY